MSGAESQREPARAREARKAALLLCRCRGVGLGPEEATGPLAALSEMPEMQGDRGPSGPLPCRLGHSHEPEARSGRGFTVFNWPECWTEARGWFHPFHQ